MRLISFARTTAQYSAGIKTVTRRRGWAWLKPGTELMAVEKAMGLKKGHKPVRLGPLRVLSVRREPLNAIDQADVIKEGYPDWTPEQFIAMYCEHSKNKPTDEVTRIEFERF